MRAAQALEAGGRAQPRYNYLCAPDESRQRNRPAARPRGLRLQRKRGPLAATHSLTLTPNPMTIAGTLLPEFDQEMTTTRRLLERVPTDKGPWRPHPKSFPLGHLAQLVAWMPGWIANTVRESALDLATAPKYSFETTETLLKEFDTNVRAAREALAASKDADYPAPWSLKHGDRVLFTAPRGTVVRTHINHLIHHRGQLSVYLRLNNVPLPPIYGPTADEGRM